MTSNQATDKYFALGTRGQIFDDGNFHIHTNSGNLWINSLDGGDINLGLQTNSGSSKVKANNISLDAGYGSVAPIYGVRAWINCGYNGSTMTTRASGNLSVSRSAVGVYNFTFGTAMPDGSYPIESENDLKNAIRSWGRGGAKPEVKAHIKRRAKQLGQESLIPENWKSEWTGFFSPEIKRGF